MSVAFGSISNSSLTYVGSARQTTVTCPSGTQPGDLLIIVAQNEAPDTFAVPTGFTLLAQPVNTSNDVGSAVFYKFATGSDTGGSTTYTVAETQSGTTAQTIVAVCIRYVGVDSSKFPLAFDPSTNNPSEFVGLTHGTTTVAANAQCPAPTNPAGTVGPSDLLVRVYMSGNDSTDTGKTITGSPPAGWTQRGSYITNNSNKYNQATVIVERAGAADSATISSNKVSMWDVYTFILPTASTVWSAAAAFSGSGSLGAAVNQGQPISTGFSGAGTLTAGPNVNYGIAVTLTGAGSMSATGVRVEYIAFTAQGTASILAADFYRTQNVEASFSGTSHLSAAPGASGAASFSASGSMSVGTPQQDHAGKATWSALGSLAANAQSNQYIGASFAGIGELTAAGVRLMFIDCDMTAAGSLGADARRVQPALASFSAAGQLFADPLHTAVPVATFAGTGLFTIDATALGPVIGHWNAPAKGIPAGPIGGSLVFWRVTLPGKSTILVETSVDNGASWQVATNGAPVPRLPNNSSVAKAVLTRVTMTRSYGADPTPRLHQLEIRLGIDDTRDELCPLGVFTLNDTVISDGGGGFDQSGGGTSTTTAITNNSSNQIGGQGGLEIEISGSDLSRKISRNLWDKTYVINAGTNYGDAIKAVITDRLPGTVFNFVSTDKLTPRLFFGEQSSNDPWQDAMDMAESIGCWLFFDARGICVMREEPDPDIDPAVWTFRDTANPVITQLSRKITDQDTYNYVIVTGESSANDVPARGTAIDDDPSSPTYYLGPYGTVTYRVTTPLVSDDNQAFTMAQALLRRKKGATETVEMDVVPNSALEPGDVVGVERTLSKITGRFSLDGYSIPLAAEQTMHLVTRRQRI